MVQLECCGIDDNVQLLIVQQVTKKVEQQHIAAAEMIEEVKCRKEVNILVPEGVVSV